MNLSTVALALLVWQLLSGNGSRQNAAPRSDTDGLSQFLSDDTKNLLECVNKLSDKACSGEDKMGAIFQMMSNPAVMNIANGIFGANKGNSAERPTEQRGANGAAAAPDSENQTQTRQKSEDTFTNDEGYAFETPSQASREFFRPIDNIADAEIKHKLYWFYDNWYLS